MHARTVFAAAASVVAQGQLVAQHQLRGHQVIGAR